MIYVLCNTQVNMLKASHNLRNKVLLATTVAEY